MLLYLRSQIHFLRLHLLQLVWQAALQGFCMLRMLLEAILTGFCLLLLLLTLFLLQLWNQKKLLQGYRIL
jgi:hypothetical protein